MFRPRASRGLTITLMIFGALAGVIAVILGVSHVARSMEPTGSNGSDAMLVMIEIVLAPLGLALGAACGGALARALLGDDGLEINHEKRRAEGPIQEGTIQE